MENPNLDITIYTSPGCFYCEKAKELCKRANVEYQTFDTPRDKLTEMFPNATGYPWIEIDGKEIGTIVETAKFFLREGLVSAKKV